MVLEYGTYLVPVNTLQKAATVLESGIGIDIGTVGQSSPVTHSTAAHTTTLMQDSGPGVCHAMLH
jgi:hypothetical protein